MEITQKLIKSRYTYKNGNLYWKISPTNNIKIGSTVGCIQRRTGYKVTYIFNRLYYVHRLIFLYHHGYLPTSIDRINRDKTDNRIENLRECNPSQNIVNGKARKGTSKYRGVYWDKTKQVWITRVSYLGKVVFREKFTCEREAAKAYDKESFKYYKDFVNLNFPEELI